MQYINLTPHSIDIYPEAAFENLEKGSATAVNKEMVLMKCPSEGVARIGVNSEKLPDLQGGIPCEIAKYEELLGIPEWMVNGTPDPDDVIIVSMPTQAYAHAIRHPLAKQMAIPAGAVRLAGNGSVILGCTGLSFYQKAEFVHERLTGY